MKDEEMAFPVFAEQFTQYGMTLRDYFAGQVLGGTMMLPNVSEKLESIAKYCYDVADAMLAEKEKTNGKDND